MNSHENPHANHQDIRIGTLVRGTNDPAAMIRRILPYGFECFALTYWQRIDQRQFLDSIDPIREALSDSDAFISCLNVFGNPLGDEENDAATLRAWELAIDHASDLGCDLVAGFAGRVRGKPVPESIPRFKEVWSKLADRAAKRGVRIAFENCEMGGSWQSGNWNIAFQPAAWELMFEALPADHVGLEWEPAHQLVQLIDPWPQLRHWVHKMLHVHGKDAMIKHDVIRETGVHGPVQWADHTMPGKGDCDWAKIIAMLRQSGYRGTIDIEGWHDPDLRGDLEMTGQVFALNYLKTCRGGPYVPVESR